MKTITTFILIILIGFCGYSQNTYVPDDNFEQALIDLGYDTGTLDNYVLTASIDTLTYLYVSGKNINDLSGIQDFTALSSLYCQNNNITDLKITSNTALQVINCSNNAIADLNLSQNTDLRELFCGYNALTDLDLSKNVLLNIAVANDNQLRILNIKNGSNTTIFRLDTRNNPSLTCINVDDAVYSTTNWTFIDPQTTFSENCSANNAMAFIPDDNFEKRLIDLGYDSGNLDDYVPIANINSIVKLDVSGININDLTGIEYFENLSELDCSDNSLAVLNLSKNTALNILQCKFNMITSLDLTQNSVLKELSCSSNNLTSLNLTIGSNYKDITYFDAKNNPNLTCIQVDDETYSTINWTNVDSQTIFSESCGALSIDEYLKENIFVYPNPTSALVNVNHDQPINIENIKTFDILGRELQHTKNEVIDLSHYKTGLYFLKVETNKGNFIKKVIKF